MRIEILKYLSDSHSPKPLNEFLKKNIGGLSLRELVDILGGMISSSSIGVMVLYGDYWILGKKFINDDSKLFSSIEKDFGWSSIKRTESSDENNPNLVLATLDNIRLEARINEWGRKEVEEYDLRQSIKRVNQSVIKTNRATLIIAILAAIFSFGSLIFPLLKSDKLSIPEMQETNKILQKQAQGLDNLQQTLQNFDSLHKKIK